MAKQGVKTSRLVVDLDTTAQRVTVRHEVRDDKGEFKTTASNAFNYKELPANIAQQVALYGLNKLLQDRTSQFRELGIAVTMQEMQSVFDVLKGGNWSATRKARAGGNDNALLIAVMAEMLKKPIAVVAANFDSLGKDQQKALAAKFADQVAKAKAEAEASEDLFDGLLAD